MPNQVTYAARRHIEQWQWPQKTLGGSNREANRAAEAGTGDGHGG
jgi:hypothetical protein